MQNAMRKLAAGVAASTLFAAAPAKAQSAWEGFYLGVQGGYQMGEIDLNRIFDVTPKSIEDVQFGEFLPVERGKAALDFDAFVGGGHVGYHAVRGPFLFGFEADLEFANNSHSTRIDLITVGEAGTLEPVDPFSNGQTLDVDVDQTFQSSLRGKVGWAGQRVMVYATGGLAIAQFDYALHLQNDIGENLFDSFSDTALGYTIGAGAAYLITDNISLGAEYRFTDYGFANDTFSHIIGDERLAFRDELESDLHFHTVRAKLSYHF